MASIFDSPLFWIVFIWWLISTIFGAKARQRRALQARSRKSEQPPVAGIDTRIEDEPEMEPGWEGPAEMETEGELLEAETMESDSGFGEISEQQRPSLPPGLASPLESLFRSLGVPESGLPSALRPQRDIFPLKPPEPVEVTPESPPVEPIEVAPEPLPVEPAVRPMVRKEYIQPSRREYPLLPDTTLARLTPMQQAILFKEILDRPRAQRRAIR